MCRLVYKYIQYTSSSANANCDIAMRIVKSRSEYLVRKFVILRIKDVLYINRYKTRFYITCWLLLLVSISMYIYNDHSLTW